MSYGEKDKERYRGKALLRKKEIEDKIDALIGDAEDPYIPITTRMRELRPAFDEYTALMKRMREYKARWLKDQIKEGGE